MKHNEQRNGLQSPRSLRQASIFGQYATAGSIAGAMLMAGGAGAAESDSDDDGQLDPSVINATEGSKLNPTKLASPKYPAPLSEIPRTITVVPEELIKQQNATTIADALRNVPGISLQAGEGGTPAGDQLTLRGFDARTDFFIDGIRDIGGYTRDPFNYEQIEVSKGPGSTDTGRGSTGGSINLATKTPKLEQLRDLTFGVGTDDFYRVTLDWNQPLSETSAFRLNLLGHSASNSGRDWVENERWGIAPSIAFGLGTDTVTTLSYMHMSADNMPDYGIPWVNNEVPSGVDFNNWYGLIDRDYSHVDTDIFTAEVKHSVNADLDLRAIARYGRNHRDSLITAPRLDSTTADPYDVRRTDEKFRLQTTTTTALAFDLNYRFKTGGWEHTLIAGADYTWEKDVNEGRTSDDSGAPGTDLYDPDAHGVDTSTYSSTGTTVARTSTIGFFLYDTIKFNDQWSFNGGLRYDNFDAEIGDASQVDNFVSWRSSVSYKPAENGTIYFAYGTSVNPSAEALSFGRGNANLGLDPEESETWELGTKWTWMDDRIGFNAAIFKTNKTNARTTDPSTGDTVLEGDIQVQGVELGLTGKITDKWSVFAGYTYLDGEQKSDPDPSLEGGTIGNTPEHSFSIWTTYDLTDDLTIGGGIRYVGDRDNGRGRIAPSYTTYDAFASYQVNEDVSLQLNVTNLTDEDYVDQVGGGHFIPGAGRTATVSVKYSF
ncbi:TonB-dependent siderophore receptor [Verrucomicrobiaceae bacterium 5K15]|uniref:TonB-dependent siderophore receptor n=1 Tax=Oceaniferula flava TaxID=2800421 RepID=A0AAE2SDJ9_9BACT|nr:TonB-dependent siderophore receptor [Oceaniferula flavus]MBK1854904.1 TonB-dependent siderophore receptor [Oceaniferula flavus]MBM1136210.1 TonB-dependent siderophore receptor [Oceaniferula flavus]